MWKWTAVIMSVLLVASNGWWFYQTFDEAVTELYREQNRIEAERTISGLKAITNELVRGMPEADFRELLVQALPDEEPFDKEGRINVPFLSFPVSEDGVVTGVE